MTDLQKKLYDMLVWFHKFTVEKGLKYYMVGGTMLGAVRHGGFIPWDDDIDVAMPRADYDKAIELLKDIKDGYFIEAISTTEDEKFIYTGAKLYDARTTLVENMRRPLKRGIFIDVFPLDGIGNSPEEVEKNYKKINRKNNFLMTRTCALRKDRKFYKNVAIILARLIPPVFINEKKYAEKIVSLCAARDFYENEYVGNLLGSYGTREIMPRETFGTPTLCKFEETEFYGPEKADEFLTHIYGEWRKLPPEEKRKTTHTFLELDLDKPYMGENI